MSVPDQLALALLVAGVAALCAATLRSRNFRAGLAMLLELWMAAALLRLSFDRSLHSIASAAALLLFRVLALRVLRVEGARPWQ